MHFNILWSGIEYDSLENCRINIGAKGAEISSTIIGYYENKIYQADYVLTTNADWQILFLEINFRHGNKTQHLLLQSDSTGNWRLDGREAKRFNGCFDIDIPLTPFTNTLPIRRLQLQPAQSQEISVVYCDLLAGEIKPVRQKYTCLSATEYHYENVPNDFEATIKVDAAGLVVDYPSLFVRKAISAYKY